MRALIEEWVRLYAGPLVGFLAIITISAIFAGLQSFGRMGGVVTGILCVGMAIFGKFHPQVAGIFVFLGIAVAGIFGYLLFFGVESRRRR